MATKFHVASACGLVFLQQVGWVPKEVTQCLLLEAVTEVHPDAREGNTAPTVQLEKCQKHFV